jgi:hypothetical protein
MMELALADGHLGLWYGGRPIGVQPKQDRTHPENGTADDQSLYPKRDMDHSTSVGPKQKDS